MEDEKVITVNAEAFDQFIRNIFNEDELFTINQVAKRLRCSRVTLLKIRKEGKIKSVSIASKILFKKSEIERFLNNQQ